MSLFKILKMFFLVFIFFFFEFSFSAQKTIRPNGLGSLDQWPGVGCYTPDTYTPTWDCVNDIFPDAETTYAYVQNDNLWRESWNLSDVSDSLTAVDSLRYFVHWRRTSVAYQCSAYVFLRINSTNYDNSSILLSTGYSANSFFYDNSPATGQEWTVSEINNLQAGVGTSYFAGVCQARVTQAYLIVYRQYSIQGKKGFIIEKENIGLVR